MEALIDYKSLRKINPEAARLAVLQYLSSSKSSINQCAKTFGVQRTVIYDILSRKNDDLKDKSKKPHKIANKTPEKVELMVISLKQQTNFGPKRLFKLLRSQRISIPYGTIRGILRRNKK